MSMLATHKTSTICPASHLGGARRVTVIAPVRIKGM